MIVLTHSLDERRRWTCLATAWLDSSDISSSHLESSARTLSACTAWRKNTSQREGEWTSDNIQFTWNRELCRVAHWMVRSENVQLLYTVNIAALNHVKMNQCFSMKSPGSLPSAILLSSCKISLFWLGSVFFLCAQQFIQRTWNCPQ